jgi:hypothetical protein
MMPRAEHAVDRVAIHAALVNVAVHRDHRRERAVLRIGAGGGASALPQPNRKALDKKATT